MRRFVVALLALAGCKSPPLDTRPCASWWQWGRAASHEGSVCIAGQAPSRALATVTVDPFGAQETAADQGDLLVHYQVPLVVGDDVYVMGKSGSFSGSGCDQPDGGESACYVWGSERWAETRYHWSSTLDRTWTATSDWKPLPAELAGTEPMFQPVVTDDFLYLPAVGGTLSKIDRHSGAVLARVGPSADHPDPDTYVSGPLTSDAAGSVYYNILHIDHDLPVRKDAKGWLVRVDANDATTAVSYDALLPDAPTGMSCRGDFASMDPPPPLPWPPPPNAGGTPVLPPLVDCGSQRPGVNVAPAIGADGTIFTVSRAHFSGRYGYVVALNADLTPRWTTSLRGILDDGCSVLVSLVGDPAVDKFYICSPTATRGVDPVTNERPAGRVVDDSSSSPVALPDGGVLYGAYTSYNGHRGHLFKLAADGTPAGTFDFGWDYTPAIWRHGGTYSIVVKDNHYESGTYFVTQLDAALRVEWQLANSNTLSCTRDSKGNVQCHSHPAGFEWCINAPAIDKDGTIYAGGEDGFVYAIGQGGVDKGHLFLSMALGASYTPLSIDARGRLYTQNDGTLTVVGQ